MNRLPVRAHPDRGSAHQVGPGYPAIDRVHLIEIKEARIQSLAVLPVFRSGAI